MEDCFEVRGKKSSSQFIRGGEGYSGKKTSNQHAIAGCAARDRSPRWWAFPSISHGFGPAAPPSLPAIPTIVSSSAGLSGRGRRGARRGVDEPLADATSSWGVFVHGGFVDKFERRSGDGQREVERHFGVEEMPIGLHVAPGAADLGEHGLDGFFPGEN